MRRLLAAAATVVSCAFAFVGAARSDAGPIKRWGTFPVPAGVAVAHDGAAYVLGNAQQATGRGHPVVAVIAPGRAPDLRMLPMAGAGSIAVDARDRLWISAPPEHGAAVIAPKGAWN